MKFHDLYEILSFSIIVLIMKRDNRLTRTHAGNVCKLTVRHARRANLFRNFNARIAVHRRPSTPTPTQTAKKGLGKSIWHYFPMCSAPIFCIASLTRVSRISLSLPLLFHPLVRSPLFLPLNFHPRLSSILPSSLCLLAFALRFNQPFQILNLIRKKPSAAFISSSTKSRPWFDNVSSGNSR